MDFSLHIATLNVHGRHDRWRRRRELIVGQLLDAQPHLIALQEVNVLFGQARWLRNQINNRLGGGSRQPYRLVQKRRRDWPAGLGDGIAILTRLPLVAHDWLALGDGGRLALRTNIALPNQQTVDFVCVHLVEGAVAREARREQAMRLTGWLNERARVPAQIVAGDFAEVTTGPAIGHMRQQYRSAYAAVHGHDPVATYPTALVDPQRHSSACYDYIFLSRAVGRVAWTTLFCRRPAPDDETLYPSDHIGLLTAVAGPVNQKAPLRQPGRVRV